VGSNPTPSANKPLATNDLRRQWKGLLIPRPLAGPVKKRPVTALSRHSRSEPERFRPSGRTGLLISQAVDIQSCECDESNCYAVGIVNQTVRPIGFLIQRSGIDRQVKTATKPSIQLNRSG
jgi:hypothetical protein